MLRTLLFLFAAGTTTMQRVPATRMESFPVSAKAGQTLLVEVNVDHPSFDAGEHKIAVLDPASKPLTSSLGDDTSLNWMRRLAASGNYRVQIACPTPKPYSLRLTLLEPDDPRLDPGVRPEQISVIDPGHKITWSRVDFVPVVQEPSDYGPAHWKSQGGTLEFTVMPVEGVNKTWWIENKGSKALARLMNALKSQGPFDPDGLPGDFNCEAALTFTTQVRRIEGPGIRGVRWLGSYDQSDASPVSPLTYAVDAITTDGKLLVIARGQTAHKALPKDVLQIEGAPLRNYRRQMSQRLDREAASNFGPDLEKLDAIVRSFVVR